MSVSRLERPGFIRAVQNLFLLSSLTASCAGPDQGGAIVVPSPTPFASPTPETIQPTPTSDRGPESTSEVPRASSRILSVEEVNQYLGEVTFVPADSFSDDSEILLLIDARRSWLISKGFNLSDPSAENFLSLEVVKTGQGDTFRWEVVVKKNGNLAGWLRINGRTADSPSWNVGFDPSSDQFDFEFPQGLQPGDAVVIFDGENWKLVLLSNGQPVAAFDPHIQEFVALTGLPPEALASPVPTVKVEVVPTNAPPEASPTPAVETAASVAESLKLPEGEYRIDSYLDEKFGIYLLVDSTGSVVAQDVNGDWQRVDHILEKLSENDWVLEPRGEKRGITTVEVVSSGHVILGPIELVDGYTAMVSLLVYVKEGEVLAPKIMPMFVNIPGDKFIGVASHKVIDRVYEPSDYGNSKNGLLEILGMKLGARIRIALFPSTSYTSEPETAESEWLNLSKLFYGDRRYDIVRALKEDRLYPDILLFYGLTAFKVER